MEGEVVTMQDLFTYEYQGEGRDGLLIGMFRPAPVRPYFIKRAAYYGLGPRAACGDAAMNVLERPCRGRSPEASATAVAFLIMPWFPRRASSRTPRAPRLAA